MPETGDADFDHAARGLALAFGLDTIVIDRAPVAAPDATVLTDMTAISRGIPAITTEMACWAGMSCSWSVAERGVRNVLRHLDMLDGDVEPNDVVVWLEDQRCAARRLVYTDPCGGRLGREGARLGTVHDLFGVRVAELSRPLRGL